MVEGEKSCKALQEELQQVVWDFEEVARLHVFPLVSLNPAGHWFTVTSCRGRSVFEPYR